MTKGWLPARQESGTPTSEEKQEVASSHLTPKCRLVALRDTSFRCS